MATPIGLIPCLDAGREVSDNPVAATPCRGGGTVDAAWRALGGRHESSRGAFEIAPSSAPTQTETSRGRHQTHQGSVTRIPGGCAVLVRPVGGTSLLRHFGPSWSSPGLPHCGGSTGLSLGAHSARALRPPRFPGRWLRDRRLRFLKSTDVALATRDYRTRKRAVPAGCSKIQPTSGSRVCAWASEGISRATPSLDSRFTDLHRILSAWKPSSA